LSLQTDRFRFYRDGIGVNAVPYLTSHSIWNFVGMAFSFAVALVFFNHYAGPRPLTPKEEAQFREALSRSPEAKRLAEALKAMASAARRS
jgi:hypothetical protein